MGHHHESTGEGLQTTAVFISKNSSVTDFQCPIIGHYDEYLPSVHGGRVDGEEVRRKHKKGVFAKAQSSRHYALGLKS